MNAPPTQVIEAGPHRVKALPRQVIRVLLIEDNSTDALVVRDELAHTKGSQYAVTHVENLKEALERLRTGPYDVVLADLSLPDSDGLETFERLRRVAPDVPIIALTGWDDDAIAIQAVRAGAQDYLLKGRVDDTALARSIGYSIERQGYRHELAKSRANLAASQRIAHLGSWELDLSNVGDVDQNALSWSDETFRIFGFEPGAVAVTNEKFFQVVHPEDRDRIQKAIQHSLAERQPYDLVHRIVMPDGAEKIVREQSEIISDPLSGLPMKMVGTVHDITESRRNEEALQRQQAELRVLFDLIPAMIWFKDIHNGFVRVNQRAAETTGKQVEEIEGKSAEELFPEEAAGYYADDLEVIRSGVPKLDIIETIKGPTGQDVWLRTDKVPYCDKDGKVIGIICMTHDITKSRLAEETLHLLGSAVEQARDSIMITDAKLDAPGPHILFVNPAFTKLTGYTAPEVLGRTPRMLQGSRTDRSVLQRLREALTRGGTFHGEAINYRKDGTAFMLEWQVAPIRNIVGVITHYVAIQHDITERKKVEETLRSSEERFRQLAENIHEVFWLTNPLSDHILYVSPAYETVWGRSCDSLYVEPGAWLDAIHPEDLEHVTQARKRHREGGYDEQYRIVRPDQTVRWVRDRAFPVRNAQGEVYRVVGVAEDITERRLSDEALKMQGRVLESMTEGVTVCDVRGEIVFSNAACNTMFGYQPGEITGMHMAELNHMTPEEIVQFGQQLTARLREKGFWTGELNSRKKDGSAFTTQSRISVLEFAGVKSYVSVFGDITEKKSLEAQFLRSQRMESVGRLSSGIAHDLNNILAPIMMSVFMLRRPLSPEELEKMVTMIETSAQRGGDLVKQLLTFGRGSGGQRKVVQSRSLLHEMVKIIRGTFPKNLVFTSDVPADVWPVIGDATQLHQVLLNLCVNARDSMPKGGTLSLKGRNVRLDENYAAMNAEAKAGPYLLIEVADSGEGIPPEIIDKIFDPFFTTKEAGKGTGLGLSTVIGIVKSHEGFLNLRSEVGKGTTFEIHLPAVPDALVPGEIAFSPLPPRGKGEMILVVDDEPGIRDVVQSTLLRHGYRVLTAGDGTEGIALYSQHRNEVQLVMTDLMMPFMDGVTMSRTLKKMNPSIKIIASSGIGSTKGKKDRTAELLSLGIRIFLTKPYSASEFLTAIHDLLAEPVAVA